MKTKDLSYYIALQYKIILTPEEDRWGAIVPVLPGCVGGGNTIVEALEDAKQGWFLSALDHNDPIPEPTA